MDDIKNSATYADHCSFAPFDIDSPTTLTITCPQEIHSAKILPTSFNLQPKFTGKQITLTINKPQNLTLEINDDPIHSLHLFASPIDSNPPPPTDPNVIYFPPGIHDIKQTINVTDNQTLYLAPGSILRAVGPGGPLISFHGSHISLAAVRESSAAPSLPIHSRNLTSSSTAPTYHNRRYHPPRLPHLEPPHPPIEQRHNNQPENPRLPLQLRRHRHLQQPKCHHRQLLPPHPRRPNRRKIRQRPEAKSTTSS